MLYTRKSMRPLTRYGQKNNLSCHCTHKVTVIIFSILREVQAQLSADLSDKDSALEIDTECVELSNSSSTIGFHSDPTRIKKGSDRCKNCTHDAVDVVHTHHAHTHAHTQSST